MGGMAGYPFIPFWYTPLRGCNSAPPPLSTNLFLCYNPRMDNTQENTAVLQPKYVIALEQGTTTTKAVIFNKELERVSISQRALTQYFPKPGWVEHDAEEIFQDSLDVIKWAMDKARIKEQEIAALGIANQRETVIVWDKTTGKSIYNAIVWQCRRTADIVETLMDKKGEIKEKTGLLPNAYFSATKIKWILDNVEGARQRAQRGELLAGTVDSYLIWRLTGGGKSADALHITDRTNASRTMLYNIHTLQWDDELLDMLCIPKCMLPKVVDTSLVYGMTNKEVCGFEVPIAAAVGDQQASLFAQGCKEAGETKVTYNTGCFILMNTGNTPVMGDGRLVTTIALSRKGRVTYALEGSVFMGGAIIKWLRDDLGLIHSAHECDKLAEMTKDSCGVTIVPAFTGLGAPYWDNGARGIITGLTREVKKEHLCRAALEAIALQVKDAIDCMISDAKEGWGEGTSTPAIRGALRTDGGACVSDMLLQFQADILNMQVMRPKNTETTVLGAALLAGFEVGFWTEDMGQLPLDKVFSPEMSKDERARVNETWHRAVRQAQCK